jgi:hypothetical protein
LTRVASGNRAPTYVMLTVERRRRSRDQGLRGA